MCMPKASIHKNNCLIFWKNDIRFSWKPSIVFSVTKTLSEQISSDQFLRSCVFATDVGHIVAPLFRCMHICHNIPSFMHQSLK